MTILEGCILKKLYNKLFANAQKRSNREKNKPSLMYKTEYTSHKTHVCNKRVGSYFR